MITDFLIILTFLTSFLFAQAVPLTLTVSQIRAGQEVRRAWLSNAIYIGGGLAITAAHCASRRGWSVETFRAGKSGTAVVERSTGKLTLLRLSEDATKGILAARLPDFERTKALGGEWLIHKYYDVDERRLKDRIVTWQWSNRNKIVEAFKVGMSGSGVYLQGGQLVGVAELQNGTVWGVADIKELMEGRE